MADNERDDIEVVTNFTSETEALAAAKLAEEGANTPEAILARQAAEAAESDGGESEDRGDDFEPTDDGKAADAVLTEEELSAVQEMLGTEQQEAAKPIMIPKYRFDEVSAKMRDALKRAAEAEAKLAAIPATQTAGDETFDFDAAELEYMEALSEEGDREKALAIRKQIRAAEQAALRSQTSGNVTAVTAQQDIDTAFDEVVECAVTLYPFLDSTKPETMNAKAVKMVTALRDSYLAEGKNEAAALSLAVSEVGPLFSVPDATVEKPAKTEAQVRAEAALTRNAQASRQQPAPLGKYGEQGGKRTVNVAEMSEAEFDALPETEKSRLRGDTL